MSKKFNSFIQASLVGLEWKRNICSCDVTKMSNLYQSLYLLSCKKKTSRFLVFWTPGWANVVYFQLKLVYVWETVWGAAVEILRMFSGFRKEPPHLQTAHIVSGFILGVDCLLLRPCPGPLSSWPQRLFKIVMSGQFHTIAMFFLLIFLGYFFTSKPPPAGHCWRYWHCCLPANALNIYISSLCKVPTTSCRCLVSFERMFYEPFEQKSPKCNALQIRFARIPFLKNIFPGHDFWRKLSWGAIMRDLL